jgi:hypothetical protein
VFCLKELRATRRKGAIDRIADAISRTDPEKTNEWKERRSGIKTNVQQSDRWEEAAIFRLS